MSERKPNPVGEPEEPTEVATCEVVYNGRHFYGPGAYDRAELTYLRDWKRWAQKRLKALRSAIADL